MIQFLWYSSKALSWRNFAESEHSTKNKLMAVIHWQLLAKVWSCRVCRRIWIPENLMFNHHVQSRSHILPRTIYRNLMIFIAFYSNFPYDWQFIAIPFFGRANFPFSDLAVPSRLTTQSRKSLALTSRFPRRPRWYYCEWMKSYENPINHLGWLKHVKTL